MEGVKDDYGGVEDLDGMKNIRVLSPQVRGDPPGRSGGPQAGQLVDRERMGGESRLP